MELAGDVMNLRRRTTRTLVVCAAIFFTSLSTAASAADARRSAPIPSISWLTCGGDLPHIECARAQVPLDYDDPRGATTTIALARVPAADQANKIGAVFVNPGGPGGSGVKLILSGFGDALAELLQGRFDVVGFDPRGVGESDPLHCFEGEAELFTYFQPAPVFPYQADQERSFYELYRDLASKCFGRNEQIITHMSTADVARDLDLLRQAVGDKRLTFLGFSYGSYIAVTYANLFPKKIRALAMDGVLDPRLWSASMQIVSDRLATAEEFEEFLRLCDEAAADCALAGPDGASARYFALAAALRSAPLVMDDGSLYSYDVLVADTVSAMYAPEFWGGPDGYATLFASLADAARGDEAALQRAQVVRHTIEKQLKSGDPWEVGYDNSFDAYYGNHCADAAYPASFRAYHAVGAYAEAGSIFGPFWWWSTAGCAAWPTSRDRYAGPWKTRTSAPALIVGNYFDGVTDYRGAVATSKLLRNSRLLSYAGWGHTAFGRSECVTSYVVDYLLDGSLPAKGAVCPANPNPFIPAEAAASALRIAKPSPAGATSTSTAAAPKPIPLIGLPPPRPTR